MSHLGPARQCGAGRTAPEVAFWTASASGNVSERTHRDRHPIQYEYSNMRTRRRGMRTACLQRWCPSQNVRQSVTTNLKCLQRYLIRVRTRYHIFTSPTMLSCQEIQAHGSRDRILIPNARRTALNDSADNLCNAGHRWIRESSPRR